MRNGRGLHIRTVKDLSRFGDAFVDPVGVQVFVPANPGWPLSAEPRSLPRATVFNLIFRYRVLFAPGAWRLGSGWGPGEAVTEELCRRREAQSLQQGSLRCVGLKWLHDASRVCAGDQ
jgi:hypothetical protein